MTILIWESILVDFISAIFAQILNFCPLKTNTIPCPDKAQSPCCCSSNMTPNPHCPSSPAAAGPHKPSLEGSSKFPMGPQIQPNNTFVALPPKCAAVWGRIGQVLHKAHKGRQCQFASCCWAKWPQMADQSPRTSVAGWFCLGVNDELYFASNCVVFTNGGLWPKKPAK